MSPLVRAVCVTFLLITPVPLRGNEAEGPSESECRPYIEKALQGVSSHHIEDTNEILPTGSEHTSIFTEQQDVSAEEVDKGSEITGSKETEDDVISEESLIEKRDDVEASKDVTEETEDEETKVSTEQTAEDLISEDQILDEETPEETTTSVEDEQSVDEERAEENEKSVESIQDESEHERTSDDIQTDDEAESEKEEISVEIIERSAEEQEQKSVEEQEQKSVEEQEQKSVEEQEQRSIEEHERTLDDIQAADEAESEKEELSVEIMEKSAEEQEQKSTEEQEQKSVEEHERTSDDIQADDEAQKEEISVEIIEKSAEDQEQKSIEEDEEVSEETQKVSEESIDQNMSEEVLQEQSQEAVDSKDVQSEEESNKLDQSTEAVQSIEEEKSGEAMSEEPVDASEVKEETQEEESPSTEEVNKESEEAEVDSKVQDESIETEVVQESEESQKEDTAESVEQAVEEEQKVQEEDNANESKNADAAEAEQSKEGDTTDTNAKGNDEKEETTGEEVKSTSQETTGEEVKSTSQETTGEEAEGNRIEDQSDETPEEEELSMVQEVPEKLRSRDHMAEILRLNTETEVIEQVLSKTVEHTLKELKKLYEAAIKPLEILYKYRDLSNRHFGDPEIFSKPLILFMGPWSGGKSTIINYLLENEYKNTALRTGADPSPAYFNIVMWGEESEILDGTQLAADWTFSGLQKFGQVLLDRLRGLKLNHPLLQKVNIVEIPGILEIRKQVERLFPFNDACQWFIDRADIIFLVYDPSKLDIGPETEAILDQLKGREMQTRIILNKADQVKPEELMRVQGTLIWNISPLMSSSEPPVMYSTSLWSLPYEAGSPTRLLHAQEKAFLTDLRTAIEKRVENKIAGARRFAVRVRNHAKMVDCYLTTYYNHKSIFDNKKHVSDDIIEHPQNYHIYEGLSTLTNISRYDLPDPDVYRDFFRLNPVYEFQQLSSTCTYFRGCPINRLDLAIAYDLPELIGKYKKSVEELLKSHNARK